MIGKNTVSTSWLVVVYKQGVILLNMEDFSAAIQIIMLTFYHIDIDQYIAIEYAKHTVFKSNCGRRMLTQICELGPIILSVFRRGLTSGMITGLLPLTSMYGA